MEVALAIETVLSTLRSAGITVCVIGEVALNYYNVPRVLQEIEICVPGSSLSKAISILCSTGLYQLKERNEYGVYTEYKKGFPTLAIPNSNLHVVLFPDSHFHLSPLSASIVSFEETPLTAYSLEILDIVPVDQIQHLPMPRLAPYFTGLCQRFFQFNDYMARIAVEELVDGMRLDEEWVRMNLSDAPRQVGELAMKLVAERPSRYDEYWDPQVLRSTVDHDTARNLRLIPGSGYS